MVPEVFHPISELGRDEADLASFRSFTVEPGPQGRGTPYLLLPGCTKVNRVRVGTIEIPPKRSQTHIVKDGDPPQYESVDIPNWSLQPSPEGPVLLRSVLSNDGYWQAGTVYIDGEFDDPAPAKKSA